MILILTNMKYSFNHAKSHVNMEKGYGNSKPAMETAKLCQKCFFFAQLGSGIFYL